MGLFTANAIREESPEHDGEYDGAQRIGQHDLRTEGPIEEAKVGGMTGETFSRTGRCEKGWMSRWTREATRFPAPSPINAVSDQLMIVALSCGHFVGEVAGSMHHGERSERLTHDDQAQTCTQDDQFFVRRSGQHTERAYAPHTDHHPTRLMLGKNAASSRNSMMPQRWARW